MKNVLLTTSALVLFAGAAAADVTITGSGTAGIASDAGGDFATYNSAKISVAMSGETDNGLEFGASTSTTMGHTYDFGDGDGFDNGGGQFGNPEVYISGEFGKLSFKQSGQDHLVNSDPDGDVKYTGTFGDLTVAAVFNTATGDTDTTAAADYYDVQTEWSTSVSYTAGDLTVSGAVDSNEDNVISASYAMGDITLTAKSTRDGNGWPTTGTVVADDAAALASTRTNTVGIAYAMGDFSASFSVASNDDWDAALGFAANGLAFDVSTDESDAWSAEGSYDLGGGASVVGGYNHTEDAYVGLTLDF